MTKLFFRGMVKFTSSVANDGYSLRYFFIGHVVSYATLKDYMWTVGLLVNQLANQLARC